MHDLDVARWMVGEVVEVTAHGAAADPAFAALGDIDTAVVVLRFANGALGVIDNSRAARYGYECSTEVMGTRATARIDAPRRHGYEWRTPGLAGHDLPRDFEERYPAAYARSWTPSPAACSPAPTRASRDWTRWRRPTWPGRRTSPGAPGGP